MNSHRDDVLTWLGSNPTMARTLSAASRLGKEPTQGDVVRFVILRNITLEPGLPAAIKIAAARRGMNAEVELGNFDAVQQEAFASDGIVERAKPDVVVLALHLQTLSPRLVLQYASLAPEAVDELAQLALQRVVGFVQAIRARSEAVILVHGFELPVGAAFGILDPQLPHGQLQRFRSLNAELARQISQIQSSYFIDIDNLSALHGYESARDERYWHIGRAPYSFGFVSRLSNEYVKFAAALKGKIKKCLVLDCDNTLWGGVIGEDGINGIALGESHPGSAYVEFQSALLNLYSRGVLLAINSKNNHADAMDVFEKHPSSILKPEHFVATRINWQDKVSNLREIAGELNIGLDSMVFMDDSPFECGHVREQLPMVTVVELPPDASRYAGLVRNLGLFDTLTLSDEDRRRSEMYRSEARRSQLKKAAGTMDDYLKSLDMVLTISRADDFALPRIAQLTQKTNQFNLTTKRYSAADVARLNADPAWRIYYAELDDKFDRAGIIAVAFVNDRDQVAAIDTFLMSCRVIGRGVERALLASIAADSRDIGRRSLFGQYVPTAKNTIAADFYELSGFERATADDTSSWLLSLGGELPAPPDWFKDIRSTAEMVTT